MFTIEGMWRGDVGGYVVGGVSRGGCCLEGARPWEEGGLDKSNDEEYDEQTETERKKEEDQARAGMLQGVLFTFVCMYIRFDGGLKLGLRGVIAAR